MPPTPGPPTAKPLKIDAHQHFWQLSLPFEYGWLDAAENAPIKRDCLPADLQPLLRAAGVDRSVVVQTQHNVAENRWALELAEQNPWIAGVVGWIDLTADDCERQLLEFAAHPKFVGVRHITQDEPDDDFILRPPVLRGLGVLEKHGVPFDLLFYAKHLRHVPALARQLPELPMVVDHLSKPRIKDRLFDDWLVDLRAAAAWPNIYCKLSGLITEADRRRWTVADLRPYVEAAVELFGPERCMFGSDWPPCELAGTYTQVQQALVDALGPLGDSERSAIFGSTAIRFYRLQI